MSGRRGVGRPCLLVRPWPSQKGSAGEGPRGTAGCICQHLYVQQDVGRPDTAALTWGGAAPHGMWCRTRCQGAAGSPWVRTGGPGWAFASDPAWTGGSRVSQQKKKKETQIRMVWGGRPRLEGSRFGTLKSGMPSSGSDGTLGFSIFGVWLLHSNRSGLSQNWDLQGVGLCGGPLAYMYICEGPLGYNGRYD